MIGESEINLKDLPKEAQQEWFKKYETLKADALKVLSELSDHCKSVNDRRQYVANQAWRKLYDES